LDVANRRKVLHVGNVFGGGVMVAVGDYVRSTSASYDHVVLARPRDRDDTGIDCPAKFYPLRTGWFGLEAVALIRGVVAAEAPDLVHLHSSWAGLWGRLGVPRRIPVAYSPHCYAFERTDVSTLSRLVFWSIEWILSRLRRTVTVAVSPRETALATCLNPAQLVTYVPNVADVAVSPPTGRTATTHLRVVGAGRLAVQKGWDWFAQVAQAVRDQGADVEFTWLGGGPADVEATLRSSGVHVTGWRSRAEVVRRMAAADVYLHSAAWEGAPLTALEAVALRLPVLCRNTEAMDSLGFPLLFSTSDGAADWLVRASANRSLLKAYEEDFRSIAARHSAERQVDRLATAYQSAMTDLVENSAAARRS
jgi:glycosyltransferase involved in cell wall biosynthesis